MNPTAELLWLDETPSTNDYARALAASGKDGRPVAVAARKQTAGRGQSGAVWRSAPGANLTFSYLLPAPKVAPERAFLLTQAAGVAVAKCAEAAAPAAEIKIKWPNDALADGKKLSGVLTETALLGARLEYAVIGIGLNINETGFPPEIAKRATSLALLGAKQTTPEALLPSLVGLLEAELRRAQSADVSGLLRDYLARLWRYQEWAQFRADGQTFTGAIQGADSSGRLAVQRAGADTIRYYLPKEIEFAGY